MIYKSPIGNLKIEIQKEAITSLVFDTDDSPTDLLSDFENDIKEWLDSFFSGNFSIPIPPLNPIGSDFEHSVWEIVKKVSPGSVYTYGEIAKTLGDPNLSRAVGRANGKNPIPLFIPCHRIVGKDNQLTGYSGGLDRKKWLLKHEGALLL